MAHDRHRRGCADAAHSKQGVSDEGTSADLVQDLRAGRLHAGASAGRKNDGGDGTIHGLSVSAGAARQGRRLRRSGSVF